MPTFLTVKEAAKATGRSTSSIRRAIYPILKDDAHPERIHIEPSVEDALKLRVSGVGFPWRVSEELLARVLPVSGTPERGNASGAKSSAQPQGDLLAMLQRELEIKNQQITRQQELMNALSERLREGNILMGSLQQRLSLAEGHGIAPSETPKPQRAKQTPAAKPTTAKHSSAVPVEKAAKVPAATKLKPTFFGRLFGRK